MNTDCCGKPVRRLMQMGLNTTIDRNAVVMETGGVYCDREFSVVEQEVYEDGPKLTVVRFVWCETCLVQKVVPRPKWWWQR
jgi:hypothetical protein